MENNEELQDFEFKNRQSLYPNRRLIKIIHKSNDEILADIVRADESSESGTEINAEVFDNFQKKINKACSNASQALATAGESSNLNVLEGQTKFNKNLNTNSEGEVCLRDYVIIGENIKVFKGSENTVVIGFPTENDNENIFKIKKVSQDGNDVYEITADQNAIKVNGVSFLDNTITANSAVINQINSDITFSGSVSVPDVDIL